MNDSVLLATFGSRLKFARERMGLKQRELGDKVGLKQSVISKLESGDVYKTTKTVEIADALNIAVRWLVSGEGTLEPPKRVTTLLDLELALQKYNLTESEIREVEKAALDKAQEIFIRK